MPTSMYIDAHARLSTVYFVLVIVGVLRARSWGIKPSDIALVEVPLLALYCASGGESRLARRVGAGSGRRVRGACRDVGWPTGWITG